MEEKDKQNQARIMQKKIFLVEKLDAKKQM
jgi:hypothetical protein